MKSFSTENIRNVVLLGHSGSGKTTLAEALLTRSGTTTRVGRVDDGSSTLDTEPEEIARHISISLAIAPFEWTDSRGVAHKINLIDTPGYADFIGDVDAALAVADLALFVVSAVEGVEVQTEALWRRCVALGMPRMVFINKEDKERADFHRVLGQLRAAFGPGFAALELPIGEEAILKYKKGEPVRARVLDVDVEKERISLGIKQLAGDPLAGDVYRKGQTVTVTVTELTSGGIEVKFGDDEAPVTAFIRKADLSRDRSEQRPERFAVGDRLDAQITNIDKAARRISLSVKALEAAEVSAVFGRKDPGDCFLIATARVRRIPIITRDGAMAELARDRPDYLSAIIC